MRIRDAQNESAFRLYASEVGIHSALGELYRGVHGMREYFRDFFGTMEDTGAEVEEWIDGGDEVIAVMHTWGRRRRGGVPGEQHEFHVWTVRHGNLVRGKYSAREPRDCCAGARVSYGGSLIALLIDQR
jgi:hypothetical protein